METQIAIMLIGATAVSLLMTFGIASGLVWVYFGSKK